MVFATAVFPFIVLLASPRSMPPLNDTSGSNEQPQHITSSTSTSDYSARRNHPTAYDDDPAFKGPLVLDDLGTPDAHRQRIRCHYLDDERLSLESFDGPPSLDKSTPTNTILKSIVDHLAQSDAPVDAKEVAESIEFYLRSGKRLLGAARRVLQNSRSRDSTIAIHDLCSGHGLTGMIFVACNPPGRVKDANIKTVLVDRFEPMSHSVLRDCISEVCPWVSEESVQFESVPLEDFASRNERDTTQDASIVISTHACGSLTDKVLEYAMDISASAAAVMPCCYTGTDSGVPYGIRRMLGVSLAADVRRSFYLQENGYHVDFATIPKAITPMNRLILAERRK